MLKKREASTGFSKQEYLKKIYLENTNANRYREYRNDKKNYAAAAAASLPQVCRTCLFAGVTYKFPMLAISQVSSFTLPLPESWYALMWRATSCVPCLLEF